MRIRVRDQEERKVCPLYYAELYHAFEKERERLLKCLQ